MEAKKDIETEKVSSHNGLEWLNGVSFVNLVLEKSYPIPKTRPTEDF